MRVSCNSHDYQEFSQHKQEYLLMTQDYQPQIDRAVPNISIVENTIALLPSLSEQNTLQGEDIFYSINEDDISYETYSGQSENIVRKSAYVMDKNEMQSRREQREKEDDCLVQDSTSAPERNNRGSFSTEENSISPLIRLSGSQNCQSRKEREKLLRGRGGGEGGGEDVCRRDVLEDTAGCVEGKLYEMKPYKKLKLPISVSKITSECQDTTFKDALKHGDTIASKDECICMTASPQIDATSNNCSLQGSGLSISYVKSRQSDYLNLLQSSSELDKDGHVPDSEINANSFKSVTIQMPSKLTSNKQSISLSETAIKDLSMDLSSKMSECPRNESLVLSEGKYKQTREASAQTHKMQAKKETMPPFHCFPSFHGHGHLMKSASLDTGLHREYSSYSHEPLNTWCTHPMAHCCSLNSHHCCFMRSFPLAATCKFPTVCWSSHSPIELQLWKTLRLLQDSEVRNISSVSIAEGNVNTG